MLIYPALDILDGRCVRLKQGVFDNSTVYSNDPTAILKLFELSGATHVHVVDLSGAKDPSKRQTELISQIVVTTGLKIQVGGGLRTFEQGEDLLSRGADRIVIGSAAVSDPELVVALLAKFGVARVTVALDVNLDAVGAPSVALHGWKEKSAITVAEALRPFAAYPTLRVLCTDIGRDGMMTGPNVELYKKLLNEFPQIELQASGGVRGLADLLALKAAGLKSAIVGKALYEGAVDLKDALARC